MAIKDVRVPSALLDVETQIYLAEQSGQLSGPGYDIEALKAAGLVVPDKTSPTGVRSAGVATIAPVSSVGMVSGIEDARMPKLDVETQLEMARQTGKLKGPGWDIEELKAAGLVVPDKSAQFGVALPPRETRAVPAEPKKDDRRWFWETVTATADESREKAAAEAQEWTRVDIGLTKEEKDKIADAKARNLCQAAMKTHYTPKLWKVKLRDGTEIYVEALNNEGAKQKAIDAGHKVAYATRVIGDTAPAPKPTTAATISVKDGKTGKTVEFSKEAWDAWPAEYQKLVRTQGFDAAMSAFRREYRELGDGSFMRNEDFSALPTKYADRAVAEGFAGMMRLWESDHVQLGDGQWMAKSAWAQLVANDKEMGTNLAETAKKEGYGALVTSVDEANAAYRDFQQKVERGDIIPVAGDQYITREELNKLPSGAQQIVKEGGFQALADATEIMHEKHPRPKGASWDPGIQKKQAAWDALPDKLPHDEFRKLSISDRNLYRVAEG